MRSKKGVTMIEAMGALTIVSLALYSFMKMQKTKAEDEMLSDFKYDLKKVIDGLEQKILVEKEVEKDKWVDSMITNDTFRKHFKQNLVSMDSKCGDSEHPKLKKDYAPCYLKLNVNQFRSNIMGRVVFDEDDEFKFYTMTFKPKSIKGLRKIRKLSNIAKYSFNDSKFYSNVDYMVNNSIVHYKDCLNEKDKCFLRISFGDEYDYLRGEELDTIEIIEDERGEMVSYDYGNSLSFDSIDASRLDYKVDSPKFESTVENANNGIGIDTSLDAGDYFDHEPEEKIIGDFQGDTASMNDSEMMNLLKKYGIEATYDEVKQVKQQLAELEKNPEFVESIKEQMELMCSQYDEDDYYFMSLYDNSNACYKFKNGGLK
jgi:hypothetical protein